MEDSFEKRIGPLLLEKKLMLAVAESCTGGLIGDKITNIPGSSEYYMGSITAYAYEAKERLLGVSHNTLFSYGAVSKETALEMAHGVRLALSSDFSLGDTIGVSVTGIAGPGGGTADKPVGLVWIGMSAPMVERAWQFIWDGDRLENKGLTAEKALELVWQYLNDALPESD